MDDKKPTVGDMLRTTAENQQKFLVSVADHVDNLEKTISELSERVNNLEDLLKNK
jgi:hypothetical protein